MIALLLQGPSRFDKENNGVLLGPAGDLCREVFSKLGYDIDNPSEVFITYIDDFFKGKRPPSKLSHIIFAGAKALDYIPEASGKSLDAFRGVVNFSDSLASIVTYWPQDCVDAWNVEEALYGDDDDSTQDADKDNGKSSSPTKRSNYKFWFAKDVEKCLTLKKPSALPRDEVAYPRSTQEALNVFSYNGPIFLDIETHPKTNTLLCAAIAVGNSPVYSIPFYDHTGALHMGAVFFGALIREMRKREVVVHNALFDLCFLAAFYKIPFGSEMYCTMAAGHRIYPEAEKSIAHQTTLWTNRPFHKDEGGSFDPKSQRQYDQLRAYNVKDVIVLREIYLAQKAFIAKDEGLEDSVKQVCESQVDYAYMTLHGLLYNLSKQQAIIRRCEARYFQLARVLKSLIGYEVNPGSPDQVVKYLHSRMGYQAEKTTDSGGASVAGDALYKIKLKHRENLAIDVILEMRRMVKLKGMLGFTQWVWSY
jgi:hypothetical protein